jgi:hypothetical protein
VSVVEGTLSIDAATAMQNLTLGSLGTLTGAADVTVNGLLNWTGGTMSGTGHTIIAAGAEFSAPGAGGRILDGRDIDNAGTAIFSGSPIVVISAGITVNNSGLVSQQADSFFIRGPGIVVNNSGTFIKSGGTVVTTDAVVNNTGTVAVETGSLRFTGSGEGNGSFQASAGAAVVFAGDFVLDAGSTLTGDGVVMIVQGTVTLNGPVMAENLYLENGTLGGAGSLTVYGTLNWTDGVMVGSGSTDIAVGAELNFDFTIGFQTRILDGRTLNIIGTATWYTGSMRAQNGAQINNTGTFLSTGDGVLSGDDRVAFINAGTFLQQADGRTLTLALPFNNAGTLEVQAGAINLALNEAKLPLIGGRIS